MTTPNSNNEQTNQNNEQSQEDIVKFKGSSGEYDVPRNLYDDMMKRFSGEKQYVKGQYEKQLEEMSGKYLELEKNFKELQKSTMSEKERIDLEKKEKEQAFIELQTKAEQNFNMYKNAKIESEIARIIAKHADNLSSPAHMALIIKTALQPDLKNDKIVVGEKDLEQAFQDYISMEENKTLLRNRLNAGSGANVGTPAQSKYTRQVYTREDLKNAEIRKEYFERQKAGENIHIQE